MRVKPFQGNSHSNYETVDCTKKLDRFDKQSYLMSQTKPRVRSPERMTNTCDEELWAMVSHTCWPTKQLAKPGKEFRQKKICMSRLIRKKMFVLWYLGLRYFLDCTLVHIRTDFSKRLNSWDRDSVHITDLEKLNLVEIRIGGLVLGSSLFPKLPQW